MKNILILFAVPIFFASCAQKSQPIEDKKVCRIWSDDQFDFPNCFSGENKDGTFQVKPEILSKLNFNKNGKKHIFYSDITRNQPASMVYVNAILGYILPNGKAHDVIFFDNGPDHFQEGLSRYIAKNGKTGFINEELEEVLPPVHDFVAPFKNGKANFCDGCIAESIGEYHEVVGGLWGIMDKKGKTIKGPMEKEKLFPIKK